MNSLIAILILGACFGLMAVGIIFSKKALRKGCTEDPNDPNSTCACKTTGTTSCSNPPDPAK